MLVVRGAVKDYDWGIVDGLERWAGANAGTAGGPQAELWFGVHPGGPSPLLDDNYEPTGEHLGDKFDIEAIPLLVKLLAAARPLSVQVHPRRKVAADQYAAQAQTGKAIYTDPFEKTEMLVALGPFEAFAGWRSTDQAAAMLSAVDGLSAIDGLTSSGGVQEAASFVRVGKIAEAIRMLLALGTPERVAALPAAAVAAGLPPEQVDAYATVAEMYPADAGALLTPLLDYVRLEAGEAIYVPAGIPHSYIRGTGLEVMTSSDNVVRLGLTSKPVHVEHAIAALVPDLRPQVLRTAFGDLIWPIDSPFVVRLLQSGSEKILSGTYRIVLLIEGTATVETEEAEVALKRGTAAVLDAADSTAVVHGNGLVAIIQSTEK